jgi:hypothetical protein
LSAPWTTRSRMAGMEKVAAQDSRPSGSLLLSRKALASSTSCRFSPAHCNGLVATVIPVSLRAFEPDGVATRSNNLRSKWGVKHLQVSALEAAPPRSCVDSAAGTPGGDSNREPNRRSTADVRCRDRISLVEHSAHSCVLHRTLLWVLSHPQVGSDRHANWAFGRNRTGILWAFAPFFVGTAHRRAVFRST